LTTTHLTGLGELATEVLILDRGNEVARGPPKVLLKNMGVNDVLYLRAENQSLNRLVELLQGNGLQDVATQNGWITAAVPGETKLQVVKSLMLSGLAIDDMLIERSKIESGYLSLIAKEPAS